MQVSIFEGDTFDDSEERDTYEMPAPPMIGDTIVLPIEQHLRVIAVEHRFSSGREYACRVLVEYVSLNEDTRTPQQINADNAKIDAARRSRRVV